MSNKWLFFPSDGILQEITWNMTDHQTATMTSTGLTIISTTFLTYLSYGDGTSPTAGDRGDDSQPRLFNGSEAGNQGASIGGGGNQVYYIFGSAAANLAYWAQYKILYQFNGGSWESGGDPVVGVQLTGGYNLFLNMTTQFSTYGTTYVNGDTIKFRVYAKS